MLPILLFVIILTQNVNAQMMSGLSGVVADDHTKKEEAEGKEIWEKLQAKTIVCSDLSEHDFGALGEYFMGQTLGESHSAMNQMMIQMMGEEGEEKMHVVLGKRSSSCETGAGLLPNEISGLMPMMQMFGPLLGGGSDSGGLFSGNFSPMQQMFGRWGMENNQPWWVTILNWLMPGFVNSFMGWGMPFSIWWGMVIMILWWLFVIVGFIVLVRWVAKKNRARPDEGRPSALEHHAGKTALDILQERYAKGEINKQEYEEKKKDLLV